MVEPNSINQPVSDAEILRFLDSKDPKLRLDAKNLQGQRFYIDKMLASIDDIMDETVLNDAEKAKLEKIREKRFVQQKGFGI